MTDKTPDGRRGSWDIDHVELGNMNRRTRFQVNRVDTANAEDGEMEKLTDENNDELDQLPEAGGTYF